MFTLHPQLEQDCHFLADLPLCRLLLLNNAHFPWLILVPRRDSVSELIDLPVPDRACFMDEICEVSDAVKTVLTPDKLNIAALGNKVPQLHMHIIARYAADSAWPEPVWGRPSEPYAAMPVWTALLLNQLPAQ